jgi:hypothetical protein
MSLFTQTRHLSVSIDRSPGDVYAFAVEPTNLPRWAAGLAGEMSLIDGEWVANSPMGKVIVRFASRNQLGVLDHDVTLESGETVHNPLRVVANGTGSEVIFTLFKRPGVTDQQFDADAKAVARDLATLRALLEA